MNKVAKGMSGELVIGGLWRWNRIGFSISYGSEWFFERIVGFLRTWWFFFWTVRSGLSFWIWISASFGLYLGYTWIWSFLDLDRNSSLVFLSSWIWSSCLVFLEDLLDFKLFSWIWILVALYEYKDATAHWQAKISSTNLQNPPTNVPFLRRAGAENAPNRPFYEYFLSFFTLFFSH